MRPSRAARSSRDRQPARAYRPSRHRTLIASTSALFVGLLGVLLINTVLSQGAFRQHDLEVELILLSEREESLTRAVQIAESPLEVERAARKLGMVPAASPVFLRLADGEILGSPVAAVAQAGKVDYSGAPGPLVPKDPAQEGGESGGAATPDPSAPDPSTPGHSTADPSASASPDAPVDPMADPILPERAIPAPSPSGETTPQGTGSPDPSAGTSAPSAAGSSPGETAPTVRAVPDGPTGPGARPTPSASVSGAGPANPAPSSSATAGTP